MASDSKYIKSDSASEEALNYFRAFGLLAVVVYITLWLRSHGNDSSAPRRRRV